MTYQWYLKLIETRTTEVPGARAVLESLYGRIRMAIVTSSKKEAFDLIHAHTGFTRYVDFIVGREQVTESKPSPEPYLAALNRSGVSPADCLVIEDSERGLIAAKAAGLDCWVIPTDLSKGSDFSSADRVLREIADIPGLL